jgi:hypothetical protein
MKENYKLLEDLVFQIRKISPAYKARMTVEEKRLLQVYPDKIKRSVATTDRRSLLRNKIKFN